MWYQQYDPFNNEIISGLVAFLPVVLFLLSLTVFRLKGIYAALITLFTALAITLIFYDMPIGMALMAILLGVGKALWPIGFIVIMAVWLYKISVANGKFDGVRQSIISITDDQRIQLLLIGFCFVSFLEGVAGLGVPIAICSALLVTLGFHPIKAAGYCLIANAATGAFGTVGIGIITGSQVGNIPLSELSHISVMMLSMISFIIPFLMMFIIDGFKGIKETFPATIMVSTVFSVLQYLTATFIGPELTNVVPSLVCMGLLAILMQKWRPKNIYLEPGVEISKDFTMPTMKEVIISWSPFYILTAVIGIWSIPFVSKLLSFSDIVIKVPWLHERVIQSAPIALEEIAMPAIFKIDVLGSTGTAIIVSIFVTRLLFKDSLGNQIYKLLGASIRDLWVPIIIIILVLSFANLSNYSGLSASIGLFLANTGKLFPLFSPILGWLGVFLTGSVVNNNALFGGLQVVTANQLNMNPSLFVAANTIGGSMAKPIAPTSIAIAAAAVNKNGKESKILSFTLRYSLILIFIICLITFILSFIL